MGIRDPGWKQFGSGIRDGKKSDPGSGIWDKHPGSAKLDRTRHDRPGQGRALQDRTGKDRAFFPITANPY
jgi:hypothetical protein